VKTERERERDGYNLLRQAMPTLSIRRPTTTASDKIMRTAGPAQTTTNIHQHRPVSHLKLITPPRQTPQDSPVRVVSGLAV